MANFDSSLGVKTGSHIRTEQRLGETQTDPEILPTSTKSTKQPPPNKNDPSLTWSVIDYLKSVTKLPIYLKGILTAEDAELAIRHGADGIIVSNHGGRQLDGAPPTLEALPDVVELVAGRIPVVRLFLSYCFRASNSQNMTWSITNEAFFTALRWRYSPRLRYIQGFMPRSRHVLDW